MAVKPIFSLLGAIQHYDWGGYEFIPDLLGQSNDKHQPFAELWMGAHRSAPAQAEYNDTIIPLNQLIDQSPRALLGEKVVSNFGQELPFLFKVLDVRQMLSIQAHPDKQQAEAGFKRENKAGIPITAANRTYKDANHKPEVMVAISDFWLLHGFKSLASIARILKEVPELNALQSWFSTQNTSTLYQHMMEMPQEAVNQLLQPLRERLEKEAPTDKNSPDYWALKAFREHARPDGGCDRGIFSIYLLNLVHLQPKEGIFQGAGIPHAYLEGVNMELMANSDNVFRGGLTTKHIDVPELLKSLVFESVDPKVIKGEQLTETETVYFTPAPDFELSRITVDSRTPHESSEVYAPDICIVMEGKVRVNELFTFSRGDIFFVTPGSRYEIQSDTPSVLYKATVP